MNPSNRKAYVLAASGEIAVVSGRWRSYSREAFTTLRDAEAAEAGFLDRCRAAKDELLGPDPDTLSVSVVALDLEGDLDAPDGQVFLLAAEGRETAFGFRVPFLCRTLYGTRARAEAELPAFLDRCSDPSLGERYSLREDLKGRIGELTLASEASATPGMP
jgi:hypothetical protein